MLYQDRGPDGIRRVVLVAGRGNSLGPALLAAVREAFDPETNEPGPVVLTGRGASFCTGLDLVTACDLDRAAMRDLMDRFHAALRAVLLWPGPVVAALQGHALAGGALLALCADDRVMVHGSARFGIHGVQLGVVYPQVAIEVLRWRIQRRLAERVLYGGRIRSGMEAVQDGLVDELAEAGGLLEIAGRRAKARVAPAGLKEVVLGPVADRLARVDDTAMESWLDRWFDPATRTRVQAARDTLLARGGLRPGEFLDSDTTRPGGGDDRTEA